jgi:N-acetylglucosamine-6-phosphate deacetylase
MTLDYSAKALFTGSEWLNDVVIHIENDLVVGIDQKGFDVNSAMPFIIPALIDLQLYGAYGKLLSEFPEKETIDKIYQFCIEGGAGFFQPTILGFSTWNLY